MKEQEFRLYLENERELASNTINSRIKNLEKIESYYGNLDQIFKKKGFDDLFAEFKLSKGERPFHKIKIDGDYYTGTATLRYALGLYNDFKLQQDGSIKYKPKIDKNDIILLKMQNVFKQIKITKDIESKSLSSILLEKLRHEITQVEWNLEQCLSTISKDRVDILGIDSNRKIIIELDAARADQVAKKYLSRMALTPYEDTLYLSLCYPGTKSMNKNECEKYFHFCDIVTQSLSKDKLKKTYYGHFLE